MARPQSKEAKEKELENTTYSIWYFLPNAYQVNVDASKIERPPPVIPKWAPKSMPMIPVGVFTDMPNNWSDRGYWTKFHGTTAFLKLSITAPWTQVCDSSGKPLRDGQSVLTPEFQSRKAQLVAAKEVMEKHLKDLISMQSEVNINMINWRAQRRIWEAQVPISQGAPKPDDIQEWVQIANREDQTSPHTGDPSSSIPGDQDQSDERCHPLHHLRNIAKEEPRAKKRTLIIQYADDEEPTDEADPAIPRPMDRELLMAWICERYNKWSVKAPKRRDDPFEFYGLPEHPDGFLTKPTGPTVSLG
ncbi:hypothetical protein Asppvi_010750 [Aspergillus pseudoviridinutans]|uniref:Uncharacterized protein n=1 Tax=Aspergillus pseudoviridinutans TaxID=1517512 RepID=A0A9P3EZS5_9EURO|nr:uncharacterized protein Asppvi_010750 [Aspergillus pseudoviridinutans]GIJ91777.1 hypothetical protein Asppvi_010750 [Aspergillus pseudoviridinutans]